MLLKKTKLEKIQLQFLHGCIRNKFNKFQLKDFSGLGYILQKKFFL